MSERAAGVLIALFGVTVAAYAWRFPAIPGQVVGPSVFPTAIALGLAVCGVLLALRRPAAASGPRASRHRPRRVIDFAAVVVSLIVFVAGLGTLGFLPTAFVCLAGLMFVFGASRRWTLPVALAVTLAMHYAFYTLLRVPLPWGVLSGLAW